MATISTLASPGIEVREFDESLRMTSSTGTTVFIPGFACQGPVEEIMSISSLDDFENVYGQPTNAAERYFYYTVKAVLDKSNGGTTILTSRLAYGTGDGDNVSNAFTILAYPVIPIIHNAENERGYDYCDLYEEDIKPILTLVKDDGGEITPTSVNVDLVVDSAHEDFSVLSIQKVEIPEAGKLPNVGDALVDYENKPKLTWRFEETDYMTDGAIATEKNGNDLVVHLAFSLRANNVAIAILKMTAQYAYEDIEDEAYNTLTFKGDLGDATVEYVPAFEIADQYSANSEEETPKYKEVTYLLGAPVEYQISLSEYYQLISGELFDWENSPYTFEDIAAAPATDDAKFGMYKALKHAGFIVANPSRSIINDSFEGYYFGLTDNLFNTPEAGMTLNAIDSIKITTLTSDQNTDGRGLMDKNYQIISKGRIDFYLDSNNQGSISQILQNEITSFDTSTTEFDDTLNIGIFRLRKSTTANEVMKLTYRTIEHYNVSLGQSRQYSISTATSPQSYYVENVIENSSNMTTLVNPFISKNIYVDIDNLLKGKVRVFSNKLVSNLRRMQTKYITGYTTEVNSTSSDKTTIAPINAARANIDSWGELIKQAGLSLGILNSLIDQVTFTQSNSLYPFGAYTANKAVNKFIGNVPYKLERALTLIENDEIYPDIDILCDGGLSTIYPYSNTTDIVGNGAQTVILGTDENDPNAHIFDETLVLAGIEDLRTGRSSYSEYAQNVIEDYMAVQNTFLKVANSETNGGRGNTFYIADLPRGVFIKGKNTKVYSLFGSPLTNTSYDDNALVNHAWSTSIMYPCKWLTQSFTSSFASVYAQWFKAVDNFSGEKVWLPASGKVAANMCQVDAQTGPWDAAAGLDRGLITDSLDVAINPTLAQRSDLYKLCINAIPSMPNVGPVIWGVRTMSKKASAFDQNTCRRTFLYMEKHIKQVLRYFVFMRNDSYTQLRVYNEIDPFLASLQAQGAIYNYTLVCDSTNNTEEVINEGNLVVSVSAAPERIIEKIVLNMIANKYTSAVSSTLSA